MSLSGIPIENGDGEQASVDLESILPFEINEKEAEDIMMNELENMTAELGGLFKDLFKLGKRMINSDQLDDDSEDWDSEDSDDSDDSDDSEWDSDDSDFDEADLDKVLSLLDADSDEDSESSSSLILQASKTPFSIWFRLRRTINRIKRSHRSRSRQPRRRTGQTWPQAAKELDTEPGAGQDILRELGQWLINLADERTEEPAEDVVVMEFKPKNTTEESLEEEDIEDMRQDDSEEDSSSEDSSESEASSQEEESTEILHPSEETNNSTVDPETETDTSETGVRFSNCTSASALKRMTKTQLVDLGTDSGITLNIKDTKKTLLEQLETIR